MKFKIIDILENTYIYETESTTEKTIEDITFICNIKKYIRATLIETFDLKEKKCCLNTEHILRIENYED